MRRRLHRGPRARWIAVALVMASAGLLAACTPSAEPSAAGEVQEPRVLFVDLDGDGEAERVSLAPGPGGIVITDGTVVYRSRRKWTIVQADIGDSDRDGRPEVVALLEGPDGRRLGLFAWHAGQYHERLVSSLLHPEPVGLTIREEPSHGGTVVVLREAPTAAGGEATTTYRWNGFGFTAVEGREAGR